MRPGAAWRFLKLPSKIQKNQTKMHQFDFCCATTTNRVPPSRPRGPGPRTPLCPRTLPRPVASSPACATLHLRSPHMRGQGFELSPPDATNARDHSLQGHIHRRSIPRRPSRAEEGKQAAARASSPSGGAPHRPFRVPALRHLCRGLALPGSDGVCRSRQGGTTSDRERRRVYPYKLHSIIARSISFIGSFTDLLRWNCSCRRQVDPSPDPRCCFPSLLTVALREAQAVEGWAA